MNCGTAGVDVAVIAEQCCAVEIMARKLRVEYAGACYHVINRGNYRSDVFAARGAADSFQRGLFEACARFGWRLHAFVIMRNHFHLAPGNARAESEEHGQRGQVT